MKATDYGQTCTEDFDCEAVYNGPTCSPCVFSCTNSAIAESSYSQYSSDRSDRYTKCNPSSLSGSCTDSTCTNNAGKQAYCDATKKCAYGVKPDAGTGG